MKFKYSLSEVSYHISDKPQPEFHPKHETPLPYTPDNISDMILMSHPLRFGHDEYGKHPLKYDNDEWDIFIKVLQIMKNEKKLEEVMISGDIQLFDLPETDINKSYFLDAVDYILKHKTDIRLEFFQSYYIKKDLYDYLRDKLNIQLLDKSLNGSTMQPVVKPTNTIKEIDPKTCILTYQGVDSPISGKGVFGIRQLLIRPFKEIPVSFFAETSADVCNVADEDELKIESDTERCYLSQKDKNAYQKGVDEIFEDIKDLEARLKDAEGIEKKEQIEESLTQKRKALAAVKTALGEDKGWIGQNGIVRYREKKDDDGKRVIVKPSEQNKKEIDRVRKLFQKTIERIHDENLKNHLTKSITYGKELIYNLGPNPEWIIIS